jgi:hypothetical protein
LADRAIGIGLSGYWVLDCRAVGSSG